ncbi:DNA cytosine methyltransferase [Streptomyces sp. NPDC004779]
MSRGLRIGSLCTGYGGLDMAVQAVLGGTLAWVSDPDPGASRILAHHHPEVPNLGDLTAVDWAAVEPVDVVVGGYPCQPFSTAGKRKGTADARHIWPSIAHGPSRTTTPLRGL